MNEYKKLIDSIQEKTEISILGKVYGVYSKTHYTNKNNPNLMYTKFILSDDNILVINADRKSVLLVK